MSRPVVLSLTSVAIVLALWPRSPTVRRACAPNPNVEATVADAVKPEYPESARNRGFGRSTVEVEVSVGPVGSVLGTRVTKSSGNSLIDDATVRAARESTYSPKLVNCQPTQGSYLFRAVFQPH
jgi:TonB family protein